MLLTGERFKYITIKTDIEVNIMKKLHFAFAAILLVGLVWMLTKSSSPTGGAVNSIVAGLTGNIVTLVAVIAIAGIVIVTVLKKY